MSITLDMPLAFIDLETTGVNVTKDRIIEIAILKIMPDGTEKQYHKFVNPEMQIPEESFEVHGISNEQLKDAPTFKQIANEVKQFIDKCNFAGYNSSKFDIPLLYEEFLRAGLQVDFKNRLHIDVAQIFMKMEKRTLEAAYQFYCNQQLEGAHSAMNDVTATKEVLYAQLERYSDLQNDVQFLHTFSKGEDFLDYARRIKIHNGTPTFNFGKHKDIPVADVFKKEPGYYDWMMRGDFAADTKQVISELYTKFKLEK